MVAGTAAMMRANPLVRAERLSPGLDFPLNPSGGIGGACSPMKNFVFVINPKGTSPASSTMFYCPCFLRQFTMSWMLSSGWTQAPMGERGKSGRRSSHIWGHSWAEIAMWVLLAFHAPLFLVFIYDCLISFSCANFRRNFKKEQWPIKGDKQCFFFFHYFFTNAEREIQ